MYYFSAAYEHIKQARSFSLYLEKHGIYDVDRMIREDKGLVKLNWLVKVALPISFWKSEVTNFVGLPFSEFSLIPLKFGWREWDSRLPCFANCCPI